MVEDTYLLCPAPVLREVGMYVLPQNSLCLWGGGSGSPPRVLFGSQAVILSCPEVFVLWSTGPDGIICTRGFSEPRHSVVSDVGLCMSCPHSFLGFFFQGSSSPSQHERWSELHLQLCHHLQHALCKFWFPKCFCGMVGLHGRCVFQQQLGEPGVQDVFPPWR